ncbi:rRNA maturation RNase YbeY [Chitinophaga agrisoli]|uniref:Endoribonuclease YbeY n=1 Tax=Chitinophaga agrisoli TaxID=2607653 RepID=A0A5B2W2U3_9BACT|nr:rRNA maturation RNase YbeY [Chitinophaga agrisoli]KAA2245002.1 rRNA maturation RNase YbeY [Chitinophaga agrisoli]
MAIHFTPLEVSVSIKQKTRLKVFLKSIFEREGQQLRGLQYVFCSDAYLLEMNQQFLQHDTYTDIITFELSEVEDETMGEIYISIDRVRENAAKFKVSEEQELHRVIFHGALHLCGYKDKSKDDAALMRKKEDECLAEYFGS